jgi:hypothetical protein
MGPRFSNEETKSLHSRDINPGHPAHILITTLTELLMVTVATRTYACSTLRTLLLVDKTGHPCV